jgi:integrase
VYQVDTHVVNSTCAQVVGDIMSHASWKGQIHFALQAIDTRGMSKHAAKQAHDTRPGEAVPGVFSDGYLNTVYDRVQTFARWLVAEYPGVREFSDVDSEMVTEYLAEKSYTCQPSTVRTILACLRKFEEALYVRRWIEADIVPKEWLLLPGHIHRGAYAPNEAAELIDSISQTTPLSGQALRFIVNSGARIDETFHLRSDKVLQNRDQVELLGKGGRCRRIRVLHPKILSELDTSRRYVYLIPGDEHAWKRRLEDSVRTACDNLGVRRRGVHGFRGTAAAEFLQIRMDNFGYSETEGRRELAMWLGHNPQRIEVTYAYVPRRK